MDTNFKKLIMNYVDLIKKKINTDRCKFLKKYHKDEYENEISNFVPKFKEEYPFLFKMILEENDLSFLEIFLDSIEDIDNNKKNINEIRNNLGQLLHDKYVKNKQ